MNAISENEIDNVGPSGYVEFEFDLPSALLSRLVQIFDRIEPEILSSTAVSAIPDEQGVYQIFHNQSLVYVGKTDSDAGLKARLRRHATKVLHRHNLNPHDVYFKAVRVFVFTAIDLEGDMIRHYGGVQSLAWNGSGFGSNDPGRKRDRTEVKSTNFDARYTIDIDRPLDMNINDGDEVARVLARLKTLLHYTLRA